MDVKVSKDKHICRWVDQENLVYVRWDRVIDETMNIDEEGDW